MAQICVFEAALVDRQEEIMSVDTNDPLAHPVKLIALFFLCPEVKLTCFVLAYIG